MVLLFTPTSFLEITIFLIAVVAFVLAVRFFMDSRRRLEELFPGILSSRKLLPFGLDRNGFLIPKNSSRKSDAENRLLYKSTAQPSASGENKNEIQELRQQLRVQQQELTKALDRMSGLGSTNASERTTAVLEDQTRFEQLREQLEQKEAEVQRLKQHESYAQKMQERLQEVQTEFDKLQEKLAQMEQQAWQTAELTLQLEHTEQAQLQLEKTLGKKEEKLRELTLENQDLQQSLHELEDKLADTSLQRQQLQKKVQLLESLNADMQQMADSNRKLKAEISRVAELESMLHLMKERRSS